MAGPQPGTPAPVALLWVCDSENVVSLASTCICLLRYHSCPWLGQIHHLLIGSFSYILNDYSVSFGLYFLWNGQSGEGVCWVFPEQVRIRDVDSTWQYPWGSLVA